MSEYVLNETCEEVSKEKLLERVNTLSLSNSLLQDKVEELKNQNKVLSDQLCEALDKQDELFNANEENEKLLKECGEHNKQLSLIIKSQQEMYNTFKSYLEMIDEKVESILYENESESRKKEYEELDLSEEECEEDHGIEFELDDTFKFDNCTVTINVNK